MIQNAIKIDALNIFSGFGTPQDQLEDRKIARTYYPNEEKRKKAEKLLRETKLSIKKISEVTGYKVGSLYMIRKEINGKKIHYKFTGSNNAEYRAKVEERLFDLIDNMIDNCWLLSPDLLRWDGRPKDEFYYLGKNVSPYVATWCLHHNNGDLPPALVNGKPSMIMHDDDICVHRPNCINPLHLSLGNSFLNHQKARHLLGQNNPSSVFSDQDRKQILVSSEKACSLRSICLEFPKYTCNQIRRMIYRNKQDKRLNVLHTETQHIKQSKTIL